MKAEKPIQTDVYLWVGFLALCKKRIYRLQCGRELEQSAEASPCCGEGRKCVISAATKSHFSVQMADFANSGDAHGEEQNEEIIEETMRSNNVPQK